MKKYILPLILAYVSVVHTEQEMGELNPNLDPGDPFARGVVDLGEKEMVIGDESELERLRTGGMPPINPDGSVPKGYELYETFADWDALRAKITFQRYKDTEEQMIARHIERNKIDNSIHKYYRENSGNITELSDEKYGIYVVNETTGEYVNKSHFFVIAHFFKQYKEMADFGNLLNNLSNELNETYVNKYHFGYVDKNVDPRLSYTF